MRDSPECHLPSAGCWISWGIKCTSRIWFRCCPESPDFCIFFVDRRNDWSKDCAHCLQRPYLWFRKAWMLKRTQKPSVHRRRDSCGPFLLFFSQPKSEEHQLQMCTSGESPREIKSRDCWYRLPATASCKLCVFPLTPNVNMQSVTTGINLLGEVSSSNPTGSRPNPVFWEPQEQVSHFFSDSSSLRAAKPLTAWSWAGKIVSGCWTNKTCAMENMTKTRTKQKRKSSWTTEKFPRNFQVWLRTGKIWLCSPHGWCPHFHPGTTLCPLQPISFLYHHFRHPMNEVMIKKQDNGFPAPSGAPVGIFLPRHRILPSQLRKIESHHKYQTNPCESLLSGIIINCKECCKSLWPAEGKIVIFSFYFI